MSFIISRKRQKDSDCQIIADIVDLTVEKSSRKTFSEIIVITDDKPTKDKPPKQRPSTLDHANLFPSSLFYENVQRRRVGKVSLPFEPKRAEPTLEITAVWRLHKEPIEPSCQISYPSPEIPDYTVIVEDCAGINRSRIIWLIYGRECTGKTRFARELANRLGRPLFEIGGMDGTPKDLQAIQTRSEHFGMFGGMQGPPVILIDELDLAQDGSFCAAIGPFLDQLGRGEIVIMTSNVEPERISGVQFPPDTKVFQTDRIHKPLADNDDDDELDNYCPQALRALKSAISLYPHADDDEIDNDEPHKCPQALRALKSAISLYPHAAPLGLHDWAVDVLPYLALFWKRPAERNLRSRRGEHREHQLTRRTSPANRLFEYLEKH